MAAFNLTAQLNLQGPTNLRPVISAIRRELSSLTLDLNINPRTSQGIRSVTADVNQLSTALRSAQTNAAALNTQLRTLVNTLSAVSNTATSVATGLGTINRQISNNANAARQAGSEMEEFGRQSALAVRRFAAFSVATGSVYALVRAISSAYTEFVQFNKEFVKLQQVTDSTASSLGSLSSEITRLSTSLGVSSSELLNVSTTLAQAGLTATQTKTALQALARSALAPSFDNMNATVEGSIALMQQFSISTDNLESSLSSINSVAAKFAVEASDIITAIQRTGGVFAAASKGVSEGSQALNEFIAIFTSVRATTRESAETIATGLRTIFTRIQRASTIDALKEFGVTLTDLEGKFVGPYEAIRRLSVGLKGLDPRDLRFSKIIEELGGFRQIGKVIPLIQQFALAQQALGVAQRGAGSLASDAAKAQEALSVRVTKVREEFIALIRDIGQTQSFQRFVDISLSLASALISVANAAKEVLPAIAAIGAIRAVPAIGQYFSGVAGGLGGRRRFARGGMVPGSGRGDTVPAMLEPGEFVIRRNAVNAIGAGNLHRINRYAKGGTVKSLLGDKSSLANKYDTKEVEDLYSYITIDRSKANKLSQSREKYREQAENIWSQASSAYADKGSLSGANRLIRRKTGINLPSRLSEKELAPGNKDSQRLNKIQGSLAEKEAYDRMGNLRQLPTSAGADFSVNGSATNFVEVKNRLDPTSDNDLRGKALLGHQYISAKKYLNSKLDKTPRLNISLLSSNEKDLKISRRAMGGSISGQDTVPSLLTPGEFVINKKAASAIGSARLHQMNRADKVQGFNSGGFVGTQKFADGGEVTNNNIMGFSPMTIITALIGITAGFVGLSRVIPSLGRAIGVFNRSVDMGLPRTGRGTARPGQPNAGRRDFTEQGSLVRRRGALGMGQGVDAIGLAFGGSAVAQSAGENIGGKFGKQVGEAGTALASIVGVAAAIPGGLTTPLGLLTTAIVAGVAVFNAWTKAASDAIVAEQEKIIEQKSSSLDKAFEKLTNTTNNVKIGELQSSILSNVKDVISSESAIRKEKSTASAPSWFTKTFFGAKTDTTKLSQELTSSSKLSGETLQRYIIDALRKGQTFSQVQGQLRNSGINAQDIKQSIAIAQGGTAVTDIMAKITAAQQENRTGDLPGLQKELDTIINKLFKEFSDGAIALTTISGTGAAAAAAVNLFAESIKNISAVINRASAEFDEAERSAKIMAGSMPGDKLSVAGPSRLNENIFDNLRSYTSQEVVSAINSLGQKLQLSKDFTGQLTTSALSKQVLEGGLPKILAEASSKQQGGEFTDTDQNSIRNSLLDLFKNVPSMDQNKASTAVDEILDSIQKMTKQGQAVTLESIANDSKALNEIFKGFTDTTNAAKDAQAQYNDLLEKSNQSLNTFIDSLDKASDLRIQASTVRNQGSVQLSQALGQSVSLKELNASFEKTLTTLTSKIGPKGVIAGTGTNDPNQIASRLAAKEKEQADLQQKLGQANVGTNEYNALRSSLVRVTLEARNLSKAQEKLATDSSRASNALSKIQEIRRTQEAGRGLFEDVLTNINNPDWILEFQRSVQSLRNVSSGRGTIEDIAPALAAFRQRASTLPEAQAEQERKDLYNSIREILIRNGANPKDIDAILNKIGAKGETQELQDTIKVYTDAVIAQATALENQAAQTEKSGQTFFDLVKKAGENFVATIGAAAGGAGGQPVARRQNGGMIYASKGQYVNFQPRGTDTVPAMLTPGEFVVNKKATQKNIGLLKNINNGGKAYSSGGVVYARTGGEILSSLGDASDVLFAADFEGKGITEDQFDRAAIKIQRATEELEEKSSLTRNINDDFIVREFSGPSRRFISKSGSEIAKLNDADFNAYRMPFNDAYNDLKRSDILKYIDDMTVPAPQPGQPPVAPPSPPQKPQGAGFALPPEGGLAGQLSSSDFMREGDPITQNIEARRAKALAISKDKAKTNAFYDEQRDKRANFIDNAPLAVKRKLFKDITESEYRKGQRLEEKAAREMEFLKEGEEYLRVVGGVYVGDELVANPTREQLIAAGKRHKEYEKNEKNDQKQYAELNSDLIEKAKTEALAFQSKSQSYIEKNNDDPPWNYNEDLVSKLLNSNPDPDAMASLAGIGSISITESDIRKIPNGYNSLSKDKKSRYDSYINDLSSSYKFYRNDELTKKLAEKRKAEQKQRAELVQAEQDKKNAQIGKNEQRNRLNAGISTAVDTVGGLPGAVMSGIDTASSFLGGVGTSLTEGIGSQQASVAQMDKDRAKKEEKQARREYVASKVAEFAEKKDRILSELSQVRSRAQSDIDTTYNNQQSSSFNGVVSSVTGSDPYAMQIQNARKLLERADYLKQDFNKRWISRIDLAKDGRSYGTKKQVDQNISDNTSLAEEYFNVLRAVRSGESSNADFFNNTVLPQHNEAINTTRDVAAQAIVGAGTLGVGAAGTATVRGAMALGAATGAAESATLSTLSAIDQVKSKQKTIGEAVTDVATQTVIGGAVGAVTGGAGQVGGAGARALSKAYDATVEQNAKIAAKQAKIAAEQAQEAASAQARKKAQQKAAQAAKERAERQAKEQASKAQENFGQKAGESQDEYLARISGRAVGPKAAAQTAAAAKASGKTGGSSSTAPRNPDAKYPGFSKKPIMDYDQIPTGKTGGTTSTTVEDVVGLPGSAGGGRETIAYKRSKATTAQAQKPAEPSFTTKPKSFRLFNKQTIPQSEMDNLVAKYYTDKGSLSKKELALVTEFLSDPYNASGSMFRLNRPTAAMSRGGVVYASKGQLIPYMPKGTDTVPAMLTPGEFVINRAATQKHLPLLRAINNNSNNVQKFSRGGRVQYFAQGADGPISGSSGGGGVSNIGLDTTGLNSAFDAFSQHVEGLKSVIDSFGASLTNVGSLLGNLSSIESGASKLSVSAASLSSASSRLNDAMITLGSSLGSLTQSLSNIPRTIDFNATGSIPINISLDVNGGQGLDDKLSNFENDIFTKVENELRKSLPGININITRST
jgi:TP901 family phage tail tape measure protein